ncbi:hypothetical protein TDB9533_01833 [Thalassocella blandensis]|nr:hypothetical protein TDB9533_01833 [Thalassocella blandensis]
MTTGNSNKTLREMPLTWRRHLGVWAVSLSAALTGVTASANVEDQAKRIHDRLTGAYPSEAILQQMVTLIEDDGNGIRAAELAIDNNENHSFYNVTLKNWAAPWTNREGDVFADLNDYIATAIGFVRDERDFRGLLYQDVLYVGNAAGLPPYSSSNNSHYVALEEGLELNGDPGYSLKDDLEARTQSQLVPALANGGASGVITSRAGAKAFLIAGTNRAAFRFTMVNHLCLDMEAVHDVTRVPDRIRQDVSRSPGGDSRIFLNNCMGCHTGMDPMAQAMAYHGYAYEPENDPTGENGQVEYTPGTVQEKYFNNDTTFPYGFRTPDNKWANYWRAGKNVVLGWDSALPGSGTGISTMFQELAHSEAYAQCHVKRVFRTVCLRNPQDATDRTEVSSLVSDFKNNGFNLKRTFARAADYCMGE